jgi:hypothetical protein
VSGNKLVATDGKPVRLVGVNRSGAEYACIRGWGIFEGPTDAASVQVIRSWYANAVRIGLNEDCWLNINGVSPPYAGDNYQQAIIDYVDKLAAAGMYAILDLHWAAPGLAPATSLRPMPDLDHSVDFWRSVASTFKDHSNVLLDVFNEPFGVDWECWRDGCDYPGGPDTVPWQAAGMQALVNTIRATGATQPILLGGLKFSNDIGAWREYAPDDPLHQLVASFHVYPFNDCNNPDCWVEQVAPVATSVPVVISEVGTDWSPPFSDAMAGHLMHWADDHQLGYLAWTWNTWGSGEALITNYSGETTVWGTDSKLHFAHLAVPRLLTLKEANTAFSRQDVNAAMELYDRVASTPPSDLESASVSTGIDGLAHFRALLARTILGQEDSADRELRSLLESDPNAPFTRLAAQFWDTYTMTASVRAACAQLAPDVEPQAGSVLVMLQALGIGVRHDELCVIP